MGAGALEKSPQSSSFMAPPTARCHPEAPATPNNERVPASRQCCAAARAPRLWSRLPSNGRSCGSQEGSLRLTHAATHSIQAPAKPADQPAPPRRIEPAPVWMLIVETILKFIVAILVVVLAIVLHDVFNDRDPLDRLSAFQSERYFTPVR